MPELELPASADALHSANYMPRMTPSVPAVPLCADLRCIEEDVAFGRCQLPAVPPHTTHRTDWPGYQARWSTGAPPPWIVYPV
jgi:hypothetical protein